MNDIFIYSWQVFRSNIRYIIHLSVPFILLAFPSYLVPPPASEGSSFGSILGMVLYLIGFSVYISSLVFFMSQEFQNQILPVKSNIINGLVYAPLLISVLVIANLAIIVAVILVLNPGAMQFLAFPLSLFGIYVSLKSTFAPFHLILEGEKPLAAIQSSFASTGGQMGKIVVLLFVFYFSTSVVESLTAVQTDNYLVEMLMYFIGIAVTILLVAFQQIAIFKIYINVIDRN